MILPGKNRCIGAAYPSAERWERLMAERYNLATMRGLPPEEFLRQTEPWGSLAAYQRWLAAYTANAGSFLEHIVWGADRDLGSGHYLYGAMDDRYATNAERAFRSGGLDAKAHVEGKRCLVIGCWDGTENLLLHALGAACVDGCEEVGEFGRMASLQLQAWQVPGRILSCSLYELHIDALWGAYDLIYCPGVLYHLTDLPLALVMCWAMLSTGGVLAFESVADPRAAAPTARYLGPSIPGWNWWAPSTNCYEAMLRDAGFPDARTVEQDKGRGWWMGTKATTLPALTCGAAGFSRPDVLRAIRSRLR